MKSKSLLMFAALAGLTLAPHMMAAIIKEEMVKIVGQVQQKAAAGKSTAEDLKAEIEAFDALLAQHKDEKTDEVANVAMMKAMLYAQIIEDEDTAIKLLGKVKADYPETKPGQQVDKVLAAIERGKAAKEISKKLVEGAEFPNFEVKDLEGKPLSVAGLKGKVVLIDFWATWCGPCVHEMPNVIKAYEKFHDQGLEIIGVSLDQDRAALDAFLKEHKMTWPQYFDGKGWGNEVSGKYGIQGIPATFLLNREGKIAGKDLRGEQLAAAIEKEIGKK
ncbi:TlpA disulfide reductase family protein [Verrucomicrobium sp. BvORR106]|uniref:TlpA family protein disulfide reductase n=1 Tax=Verrucomicrobium sp. BvORR106 TaxID=1403819 RepID=UPI000571BAB1|nr:TlpA disulfide reductase family protein [Verrucomicrobium sp. BvORR106]